MKSQVKSGAKGSIQLGLFGVSILSLGAVLALGAFYLYQVNDLATKGYEMKEIENRIQNLEKESNRMKIREVELRSMYNIEKATENMNLVSSNNVSYVEMDSPIAMK